MKNVLFILVIFIFGCTDSNQMTVETNTLRLQLNDSTYCFVAVVNRSDSSWSIGHEQESFSFKKEGNRLNHPFYPSYFQLGSDGKPVSFHQPERSKDYSISVLPSDTKVIAPEGEPISNRRRVIVFEPDNDTAIWEYDAYENGAIRGTIYTATGDYRYLYGTKSGTSITLSAFDGSHVFAIQSELIDQKATGTFYSGSHYASTFREIDLAEFTLPEEDQQVFGTDTPVHFNFQDVNTNQWVNLNSFKGKPVVLQLFGSWCPNCYDEARDLNTLYLVYGDEIVVLGIAFEREAEASIQKQRILRFKKQLGIQYSLLHGGTANKSNIAKNLNWLSDFKSYPTLVFLDSMHQIHTVLSGYSGHATDNHEESVRHIKNLMDQIKTD